MSSGSARANTDVTVSIILDRDERTDIAEYAAKEGMTVAALVREALNEGTSFAKSLEQHPKTFPPLYVNMIAATKDDVVVDS